MAYNVCSLGLEIIPKSLRGEGVYSVYMVGASTGAAAPAVGLFEQCLVVRHSDNGFERKFVRLSRAYLSTISARNELVQCNNSAASAMTSLLDIQRDRGTKEDLLLTPGFLKTIRSVEPPNKVSAFFSRANPGSGRSSWSMSIVSVSYYKLFLSMIFSIWTSPVQFVNEPINKQVWTSLTNHAIVNQTMRLCTLSVQQGTM
jgi:hypothetical protein